MANEVVKKSVVVGVKKEVTFGTYVAPSAGTDFIEVPVGELEFIGDVGQNNRQLMNGSLLDDKNVLGLETGSGKIGVEIKSSGTAGVAPNFGPILEVALGEEVLIAADIDIVDDATDLAVDSFPVLDADADDILVGDIVVIVTAAGGFKLVSVVSSKEEGNDTANTKINLSSSASVAIAATDVVSANASYKLTDAADESLSITRYLGEGTTGLRRDYVSGCAVESLEISGLEPGAIGMIKADFKSDGYVEAAGEDLPATPNFGDNLPLATLGAVVLKDNTSLPISSATINLSNTIADKTVINTNSGRSAAKQTGKDVSGEFTVFKDFTSSGEWDGLKAGDYFELLLYVNKGDQLFAVSVINAVIISLSEADDDGLAQYNISFKAAKGDNGEPGLVITLV